MDSSSTGSSDQESCWEKFSSIICCENRATYPDPYDFSFNGQDFTPENKDLFESNFVRTTKYSLLSFLPSKPTPMQKPRFSSSEGSATCTSC